MASYATLNQLPLAGCIFLSSTMQGKLLSKCARRCRGKASVTTIMLELYNIGSGYKQVRIVIVLTFPNTRKNVFAPNVECCIKVWDFSPPNCVHFDLHRFLSLVQFSEVVYCFEAHSY